MRFSIRDLLWLTVVVALAVGWWLEHRHHATQTEVWINLPDGGRMLLRPLNYPVQVNGGRRPRNSQAPAPNPPKK